MVKQRVKGVVGVTWRLGEKPVEGDRVGEKKSREEQGGARDLVTAMGQ